MTNFNKATFAATIISAGALAAFAIVAATGPASYALSLTVHAFAVVLVIGFAILGLSLAKDGRSYAAVAALSLALVGTFQAITSPLPQPISLALASVTNGDTASVKREWDGHFRAYATVNGNPVEMLVDTGASLVLLTYEDAASAGLDMDALNFNAPILTANGRSHVATIELDSVMVGGVGAAKIKGAVAQPGMLHASLLGMSFLGAIEEAVIRKDRLILKN